MKPFKFTILNLFFLISTTAFCQYTDVINSNRPGISKSAFSVGHNVVQFEIGPYSVNEKHSGLNTEASGYGIDFTARYGLLLEELELNIEGIYQNDELTDFRSSPAASADRSNFKFFAIGAKYLVYDPFKNKEEEKPNLFSWKANHKFKWNQLIPAVSVYAGANFDTKNNPYITPGVEGFSPKVMIATQNNFASGWVFVMNFMKDRIGTDQSDFQYILTLTRAFNAQWVVFGETQGIKSDFYADNLFRVGAARLFGANFQLDASITLNTKDTPSVFNAGIGASYRLDFHEDKDPNKPNAKQNGSDAKSEGKRRKNKANGKKDKNSEDDKPKKSKKKEIDF